MNPYPSEPQQDIPLDVEAPSFAPSERELPSQIDVAVLDDAQTEVVLLAHAEVAKMLDHSTMPVVADVLENIEALEPIRLARRLFQCWSHATTGALSIARDGETLTVFIEAGALVLIESSIPGDTLGRTLVQNGRIEAEQYAMAAQHAIETGVTLGRALVDLDHLSREDLTYESAAIAREQIVGCFSAHDGSLTWQADRNAQESDRRCMIPMGVVLAEGVGKHFDAALRSAIVPGFERRYFSLRRAATDVVGDYALSGAQQRFLAFAGRAYNATDAADAARLPSAEAHALLALLTLCEEITDFTPGVAEFEARIREERERLAEQSRQAAVVASATSPLPATYSRPTSMTDTNVMKTAPRPIINFGVSPSVAAMPSAPVAEMAPAMLDVEQESSDEERPIEVSQSIPVTAATPSEVKAALPETRMAPPVVLPENAIPPMPVATDPAARTPEWIQFGPPQDSTRSTSEQHEQSREQFQKGVALLTLGNFDAAENAFREAIALRAESQVSPVYLVALGRAIYYNPSYTRDGKLPILLAIVTRTKQLAPNDPRVLMLANWVRHAEAGTA